MTAQPENVKSSRILLIIGALIGLCFLCSIGAVILGALGLIPISSITTPSISIIPNNAPPVTALATIVANPNDASPPGPVSSRCVPASVPQIRFIRMAVQGVQPANDIKDVYAVASNEFHNVWIVAAEITGPNISANEVIGAWAMDSDVINPTVVYAVENFSKEFSGLRLASDSFLNLSSSSDGVQEAILCAGGN